MPKYNLMDNLEPEDIEKPASPKEPPPPKEEKAPEENLDDTKLSDFIVDDVAISEPEMKPSEDIELEPNDEPVSEMPAQDNVPVSDGTPPMHRFNLGSDYEDEKQPGMNFRPILIGIGILAAIAIIYFAVDYFFLSGESSDEPEVVVETPEEKMRRVREEQKQTMLKSINSKNSTRLSYIGALVDLNASDVTYSSLLLYDNSFDFEVFASNRDKLAQFNVLLKNSNRINTYNIESAVNRPGSRGGVFALYNVDMGGASAGSAAGNANAVSTTPANWISRSAQQFGLNVQSQRQVSSRSENMFSVSRNEIIFEGSEDNCNSLIKQLATQNANINTHKLLMLPKNQRDMSKSAYELRLTLDFYL